MQASHYDLFAHVSKETYDREYRRISDSIARPVDMLGAYRLFQPFAALAGMAHCNVGLPFQQAYVPYVMGGGTVIPFDVTFAGNEVFLWHIYSDNWEGKPGDRLIAINGRPIADVLDNIDRFISGDNVAMKRTNIETTGFPRLYWLAYGETKTFALALQRADGTCSELKVYAVPAMQFEQKQAANKPFINSSREIKFIGATAYLRPGVFLNNQASGNLSVQDTFNRGEFIQFLDAAFLDIATRKPRSLIIDLRGNPGGDNSFSDPMVAYFADKPFRFCSRFEMKTSEVTKGFWKDLADPALAGLKEKILTHANGKRFPVDVPLYQPRAGAERFHGKVYVLVDRFTYSNATIVAALVQDYHFGVIVGEPTADTPTTYGAAHQFDLPHTKFTVMYRNKAELLAAGFEADSLKEDCPANSVFLREGREVYHTYSAYARGLDTLHAPNSFLDLTPYGRQEEWEDSPAGWPKQATFA